ATLPDLEWRIGGHKADGTIKQLQSVCPPTIGNNGRHREWNEVWTLARLPEATYTFLAQHAADREAHAANDPPAPPSRKVVLRATRSRPLTGGPVEPRSGESGEPPYIPGLKSKVKRARQALRYLGPGVKDPAGNEYVRDYPAWVRIGMSLRD